MYSPCVACLKTPYRSKIRQASRAHCTTASFFFPLWRTSATIGRPLSSSIGSSTLQRNCPIPCSVQSYSKSCPSRSIKPRNAFLGSSRYSSSLFVCANGFSVRSVSSSASSPVKQTYKLILPHFKSRRKLHLKIF